MVTVHANADSASESFLKDFDLAKESGKWMVAVWEVNKDGTLTIRRTTWNFPREKFEDAKTVLHNNLRDEGHGPLPTTPLPPAPGFEKLGEAIARMYPEPFMQGPAISSTDTDGIQQGDLDDGDIEDPDTEDPHEEDDE